MKLSNFEVRIPEGKELNDGYVGLLHEQNYRIMLTNSDYLRQCDAEVFVDGKSVGAFRLYAGRSITLERPFNDTGKFTFYKSGTVEAYQAGDAKLDKNDRGLIEVVFKPEVYVPLPAPVPVATKGTTPPSYESYGTELGFDDNQMQFCSAGGQHTNSTASRMRGSSLNRESKTSAGMTGLSGKSNQTFYNVPDLNYDKSLEAKISIRLVHDDERANPKEPRELKSCNRSTPVPAPV